MLTPSPMPATKNQSESGRGTMVNRFSMFGRFPVLSSIFDLRVVLCAFLVLMAAGCSPSGPRALFKGKKYLERGDYPNAVVQLRTAATLLATNAQAWNYYGVALQHAGQPAEAATAYQNALRFDRDLIEAHYNLGCLWM